ncbi:receptor-like protein kinase FERONIA [Quercus lobata]|uniref:receptor-like protein kinase FERONIA n=1 Tax=Quercus lobata TaxID=97700 RepID=UPI001244F8A1|nr:receptor-like protein kinase FERONIA [Quercus lobata]XP_030970491.1 receptor-like protein kinase FERONIA [Quercus lobata]
MRDLDSVKLTESYLYFFVLLHLLVCLFLEGDLIRDRWDKQPQSTPLLHHFKLVGMKGISESISKLLRKSWNRRSDKSYSVLPCRRFSLPEIKTATNNLDSNLLKGEGAYGYGKVYKGFIDNRTIGIAKRTVNIKSWSGLDGLMKEVVLLCQLRHPNVARLIGYCVEDDDKGFLVFEFIVNGNLGDHLCGTNRHEPLLWKQGLQSCIGVARALHYLHSRVKHSIIHHNVKISNILLDEKLEAKLIDFRDCKMGPPSLSKDLLWIESEEVVGTLGYLDPNCLLNKVLTDKSDVYSFGVVLLQVLCGRKAAERESERDQINRALWPQICIQEGTFSQIIDPYLMGKIAPECFKIHCHFLCAI